MADSQPSPKKVLDEIADFAKETGNATAQMFSNVLSHAARDIDRNRSKLAVPEAKLYKVSEEKVIRGLAPDFVPKSGKELVDIIRDYPWTLSDVKYRNDIPYIRLKEYAVEEAQLKTQALFYTTGLSRLADTGPQSVLSPYDFIFPRDKPTGWQYKFPFFNKENFRLNTSEWQSVDFINNVKSAINTFPVIGEKIGKVVSTGIDIAEAASNIYLGFNYSSVGVYDRPKFFAGHQNKTITISFPLYNTETPADSQDPIWEKNREFIYLFHYQNLYNKRDFTTGIPPVFYEVYIPGQHYSPACHVSSFDVQNLGNTRMEYSQGNPDVPVIVPDAYQVTIELTDMIMPNKNAMEANRTELVTTHSNTAGKANKSKTNEKKKDSDPTQGAEKYMRGLEPETPPPRRPPPEVIRVENPTTDESKLLPEPVQVRGSLRPGPPGPYVRKPLDNLNVISAPLPYSPMKNLPPPFGPGP